MAIALHKRPDVTLSVLLEPLKQDTIELSFQFFYREHHHWNKYPIFNALKFARFGEDDQTLGLPCPSLQERWPPWPRPPASRTCLPPAGPSASRECLLLRLGKRHWSHWVSSRTEGVKKVEAYREVSQRHRLQQLHIVWCSATQRIGHMLIHLI